MNFKVDSRQVLLSLQLEGLFVNPNQISETTAGNLFFKLKKKKNIAERDHHHCPNRSSECGDVWFPLGCWGDVRQQFMEQSQQRLIATTVTDL